MVRVGGGWVALDEFLLKNDPCRGMFFFMYILHTHTNSSNDDYLARKPTHKVILNTVRRTFNAYLMGEFNIKTTT